MGVQDGQGLTSFSSSPVSVPEHQRLTSALQGVVTVHAVDVKCRGALTHRPHSTFGNRIADPVDDKSCLHSLSECVRTLSPDLPRECDRQNHIPFPRVAVAVELVRGHRLRYLYD